MPRVRDWKDYIPGKGEAELGLKLKGSYGGRGGAMRGRGGFRKRNYLRNTPRRTTEWSLCQGWTGAFDSLALTNAFGANIADPPVRLVYWNPSTPYIAASQSPPALNNDASLRRLMVNNVVTTYAGLLAGNAAATQTATQAVSWDDYVGPTGSGAGSAQSGAIGGVNLHWAWIYETYSESLLPDPPMTSFIAVEEWLKNRRIFKHGILPVAAFAPKQFNFDLKFPKGISMSLGDKEIWQVSLVACHDFPATGTGSTDILKIWGMARAQYVPMN